MVGASAGGVQALQSLVAVLPADFPAAVLVVLHGPPGVSALPSILSRSGQLPAVHAVEGDPIRPGRILVAPPDHHLVVFDGAVTLSKGPKENGHRPAVDVLFRSAAQVLGPRVVGVVLSGALDDGAAGAVAIKLRGGSVVVQDPGEAQYDGMPRAALSALGEVDALPVSAMPAYFADRFGEDRADVDDGSPTMLQEVAIASLDPAAISDPERPGVPSGFGCPDCGGALFVIEEGGLVRYRCRVGHAWSPESLLAQHGASVETALFTALRALEEKAALLRGMADKATTSGFPESATRHSEQIDELDNSAKLVRDLVMQTGVARLSGTQEP